MDKNRREAEEEEDDLSISDLLKLEIKYWLDYFYDNLSIIS